MSESVTRRSPSVGLVALLVGVSGRRELPGGALVELLGELGLTSAAARGLLARMRAAGQLAGRREGRRTHYRLEGTVAEQARTLAGPPSPTAWDGTLHALLHHVPERERAFRDRLRRVAGLAGYGPLQPGVLVAPSDRAARVTAALGPVPADATVRYARLTLPPDELPDVAAAAWELPALAADLHAHLAAVRAALAEPHDPPPSADTLRRLADLGNQAFLDLLRDPGLPPALHPPDWPADDLRHAFGTLAARWLPPTRTYVTARIAAHGG